MNSEPGYTRRSPITVVTRITDILEIGAYLNVLPDLDAIVDFTNLFRKKLSRDQSRRLMPPLDGHLG